MAGEQFLLSGDQIGRYTSINFSYPPPDFQVQTDIGGIRPLGDANSRFFLVRFRGDSDPITNGDGFRVFAAVDDGNGNLVPGRNPILNNLNATPDAYDNTAVGDTYSIFGIGGGPRALLKLDGFGGQTTFRTTPADDATIYDGELTLADLAAANPDAAICFVAGTLIDTPGGPVPIETLQVGDLVTTADEGAQLILWIAGHTATCRPIGTSLAPVRFGAGSLGSGVPSRDVLVSPAHRIEMSGPACHLLFACDAVLVPAHCLLDVAGVTRCTDKLHVAYWHFALARHAIVTTSGLRSESFHPGAFGLSTLDPAGRREMRRLFPEITVQDDAGGPLTCRRCLKRREARLLAETLRRSSHDAPRPPTRRRV